ncbi:MAG: hypothetical protein ABI988_09135, partial [Nitrospirota bacterium]
MANKEKVKKIALWIDPEERGTVQFLDERDLSAEITDCNYELVDLSIETQVPHMRQRISVPLSPTEVSGDLSHYTRSGTTAQTSPIDVGRERQAIPPLST